MRPTFDSGGFLDPSFWQAGAPRRLPIGGPMAGGSRRSDSPIFEALRRYGDAGDRAIRGPAPRPEEGGHDRQQGFRSAGEQWRADDGFLRQRMVRSITRRSDGTFVLPVNLAYASHAGASHWVKASQDPDYVLREVELELVEAFFAQLRTPIGEIREFGPGDGYKAAKIIERLDQPTLKYTGFDVNAALLSEAKKTLYGMKIARPGSELQLAFDDSLDLEDPFLIDVASRPLAGAGVTVGMLLGQTLGNPDSRGRTTMLANIEARLPLDSQFLLGAALVPQEHDAMDKTLAGYRAKDYRRHILAAIEHLGLIEAGRLEVKWEPEQHNVVGYFEFDRTASIPGTDLRFEEGDRVQVFYSHRFTEAELAELLERTGFGDVRIARSQTFPYALASARVTGSPPERGES